MIYPCTKFHAPR